VFPLATFAGQTRYPLQRPPDGGTTAASLTRQWRLRHLPPTLSSLVPAALESETRAHRGERTWVPGAAPGRFDGDSASPAQARALVRQALAT
jgi:hypothetical protein